jgi:MFS transporter, OFA family, oxalate/formate antiporter
MRATVPLAGNWRGLLASMLLCLAFGSIHAFSVLQVPLQLWLDSSRLGISSGYSVAIASLTCGVFASGWLQRRISPAMIAAACGVLAAAGLVLAAAWATLPVFIMGYGLAFGLANGFAYSLSLVEAAKAAPNAASRAMGLATAVYGLGSVLSAQMLGWLTSVMAPSMVLTALALLVAAASTAAALLFAPSTSLVTATDHSPAVAGPLVTNLWILMLWLIYFLGACGGLMVIAHATEILEVRALGSGGSALAPSLVALGSIAGGYLGGMLVERNTSRACLALPLLVLTCALGLLLPGYWLLGLLAMLVCGLCYGTLISVVPAFIRMRCGEAGYSSVFGIVFTAWGMAGLCGPLAAGAIFDASGDYRNAILLALVMAGMGCSLSLLLPKR